MRFIYLSLVYTLFTIYSAGCKEKSADKKPLFSADSIIKDIPLAKDGKPYLDYQTKVAVVDKMKLDRLENGVKQIAIRIWYGYALSDSAKMVQLKKDGNWTGRTYDLRLVSKRQILDAVSFSTEVKTPRTDWDNLIKKLDGLKIRDLPDDFNVPGYPGGADGDNVIFEIATNKSYRFYSYAEPNYAKSKVWQANNVVEILHLLEEEFGLKFR
jgi:hypothetical protein